MLARILESTGATLHPRGAMYKAVAQSVLLYSNKIWVVTGDMLKGPGGVPPPGGATDHEGDRKTRVRQIVGVTLGSGRNGDGGDPPHRGVHQ